MGRKLYLSACDIGPVKKPIDLHGPPLPYFSLSQFALRGFSHIAATWMYRFLSRLPVVFFFSFFFSLIEGRGVPNSSPLWLHVGFCSDRMEAIAGYQ
ncbi:hypothetical protein LZ32DRAFT_150722 [Colletotrichum eremochloae]|nr:hypothetical protein LZ32DRAFT_150722 [Colletotrichum eremochloae]